MTYKDYTALFDNILSGEITAAPYNDERFLEYTKLNQKRSERWNKKGVISSQLQDVLNEIEPQKWILITEPWCGDAAHIVPFLNKMASFTDRINLEVQLRDSKPFLIDQYLTNGGKAIPILIARNKDGKDLFVWGPRPKEAQELMVRNKQLNLPVEDQKKALQTWYNKDKGVTLNKEFVQLMGQLVEIAE